MMCSGFRRRLSISNVVRLGLYCETIDHVERGSAIFDTDVILRIIKDTHESLQGVFDVAIHQQPLSEATVLNFKLHSKLMWHQCVTTARPFEYISRGRIRSCVVQTKSKDGDVEFCPPEMVAAEFSEFIKQAQELVANSTLDPFSAAAWLHVACVNLHPFTDGNGQMSRFLASILLIRAQFSPVTVARDMRFTYFNAIRTASHGLRVRQNAAVT
ncbi:fido domain-containing protein [Amylocystis lapponica]|nr:fido domain-containing protein [Amylocystis lapponica]